MRSLHMLLALVVVAGASPLATRDDSEAGSHKVIGQLGGDGPAGQSVVRGFFIGIGFGVLLALLCCCWWPCVHMRRSQQRAAARRALNRVIQRYEGRDREMAQTNTEASEEQTQTQTQTPTQPQIQAQIQA